MATVDSCHVGRSSAGSPTGDGQSQLNRSAVPMQRTTSQAVREGTEDLKEAAEQSLNVILDLDLDGVIRWVSPSWTDVIGVHPNDVHGRPIADFLLSNKTAFAEAVEYLKQDDSRSQRIRFTIQMGSLSKFAPKSSAMSAAREENVTENDADVVEEERKLELEGQGILVYDRTSGGKPHTMWMIRPWVPPRPIKIDLPSVLTDSLGVGAEMLAQTLMSITAADAGDPQNAAPSPILCRICERHIQPWWFEKHTELCMQEHRAELEAELAHEALVEQRAAIVRVLDALEARSGRHNGELSAPSLPPAEYKGMPIGPLSSPSSGLSSGTTSPASSRSRSREPSAIPSGHHRSRSFAVRRPMARIVELVLDLCDTAIEISVSPTKESAMEGEGLTGWAASESRISQVLQWQSPGTNTLEQERGLAALCADTESAARAKVNAVLRHRRIVEYAERIRLELSAIVQDCMDTAARKAARLAAGDSGDSTDDEQVMIPCDDDMMDLDTYPAAPDGLRSASDPSLNMIAERRPSVQMSTGSNSPRGCPTPRSHRGAMTIIGQNFNSKRSSTFFESDVGDSDSSVRSSVPSSFKRTESPASEYGLSRTSSRRDRKRHSMMLPEAMALPYRQSSPGKDIPPPSPVRLNRLRISGASDIAPSPITSPLLSTGEMQSPALPTGAYSQHTAPNHSYQYQQQHLHHRRQSSAASTDVLRPPVSPRLIAVGQPQTRAAPPSIKDFEIIKPISKGAFGSVYLSKKKTTGDYFAIKVLKKADMVAKNQVTNVKAERAIMMRQGESDYVAKLYWTFSSKDYLYLVMEYLNGGDCASLIKALGGLPEDWAKRYVAEVVLCVDDLHNRGIVHRDLKPDNLLIDQHGHLKLTDFGLSRMGLVGRQKRVLNSRENESVPDLLRQGPFSNALSVASSRSASFDLHGNHSTTSTPQIASDVAANLSQPSYFNLSRDNSSYRDQSRRTSGYRSDSGGSETLQAMFSNFSLNESPQFIISPRAALPGTDPHSAGSGSPDLYPPVPPSLESQTSAGVPHGVSPKASLMPQPMALFDPEDTGRRFVGTPDYLAPETINGVGQDEMSDWWSLGCILFEFLYGYPPFHDESPDKVFDNILQRKISWPEEEDIPVSSEAKDLMNRLLCLDPRQRLGSNAEDKYASGGDEIRSHPWFRGIRWDTLYQEEAQFIPAPEHPEDTEYFDARGATLQAFTEEMEDQASSAANTPGGEIQDRPHDALSKVRSHVNSLKRGLLPLHIPPHVRDGRTRRLSEPVPTDDFGAFTFKNLPVLEKANKDVLQKLRAGQGTRNTSTGTSLPGHSSAPSLESSPVVQLPPRLFANPKNPNRPPSPLGSDVAAASPTRASQPTSPLLLNFSGGQHHHQRRKTSSTSSGVSYQSSNSLQPGGPEVPRLPSVFKSQSVTCSPIKHPKPLSPLPPSPQMSVGASSLNGPAPRARSQTVGSQDSDLPAKDLFMQQKRRSGIFEVSPSSSDTEEARANALLRVQRRRQSSRRKSRKIVLDGPMFRPLDVLIVDENPVARIIMERLLEKMLCHTISVTNGADAIRYATSDIKFDVILIEYNLKPISGADVARMIRDTKNINAQTPIVAVTGYLKELQSPHHFDDLIEKPPEGYKLANSIGRLCNWKPPPPGQEPSQMRSAPSSSLRHELAGHAESPSSISSGYITVPSATFRGSSREDSVSSSFFGDHESSNADEPSVTIGRPPSVDWRDRGLGILEEAMVEPKHFPPLLQQQSAPPALPSKAPVRQRSAEKIRAKREILERKRHECNESGDDEDEELGDIQVRAKSPQRREQRPSKLAIEMLRTNSRGSVVSASDAPARGDGRTELSAAVLEEPASGDERVTVSVTPPEAVVQSLRMDSSDVDASVTPRPSITAMPVDNDPTPRASTTIYITE